MTLPLTKRPCRREEGIPFFTTYFRLWLIFRAMTNNTLHRTTAMLCLCFLTFLPISILHAQTCEPIGWVTQNGGVTGGGNASPVIVDNYDDLKDAVTDEDVKVVHVSGVITFPSNGRISFQDQSGKTIFGLPGAKLVSTDQTSSGSGIFNAKRLDNVIFQNLVFEGPGAYDVDGNDNMTIDDSRNIWVDHCEFRDGTDGNLDIKNKSDFITVTWTTFKYLKAPIPDGPGGSDDHRYSNLFGSSKSATGDRGKLRITMQYCWWGEGVVERMPRIRFGKIHMVNNLFDSDESNYCIRMGYEADLRLEGNVFVNQPNPIDEFDNEYTAIYASNNIGQSDQFEGNGFTPPYALTIANPADISTDIQSCAGATLTNQGECPTCNESSDPVDCHGDVNGAATYDECEICSGGNTGVEPCVQDCSGEWGGDADYDLCGVCDGNNACADCNGVIGGDAYYDNCEVCVGGNTGLSECHADIQAEAACFADGVLLESDNAGFSGAGYVNTVNEIGAHVHWVVQSVTNTTATLTFRFANGGEAARDGFLTVNGINGVQVSLPSTGGWTNWQTVSVVVDLNAGANDLNMEALMEDGLANLDVIYLSEGVTEGQCLVTAVERAEVHESIYPNPTQGLVYLTATQNWQLYNALGVLVDQGNEAELDISSEPQGVYFLKLEGEVLTVLKR